MSISDTRSTVHSDVLRQAVDVRQLAPAWRALVSESDNDEPSVGPEWMGAWWEVFGGRGQKLHCLRVRAGDELIGLAPFHSRTHWYRPGLPFRRLEMLGSGEPEADSICSDYPNLIARRGREAEVVRAFIDALEQGKMGPWDELVIPLMDGTNPIPDLLVRAAHGRGWHGECQETTRSYFITLPETWEGYLRRLDKKARYLINRTNRDFEQWADGQARFHRATDEASLEEGKRVLRSLHLERWEDANGGTFRSARFLAFHDRAMRALLAQGMLELIWLTVRGEPIAAMYDIRWGGKVSFYQCGRRMDLPKQIRPGGVLLYRAIEQAIESGMREFDFLGGEAIYKDQLATGSRPLVRVRIARQGWLEHGRRIVSRVEDRLRQIWRSRRAANPSARVEGDPNGGKTI